MFRSDNLDQPTSTVSWQLTGSQEKTWMIINKVYELNIIDNQADKQTFSTLNTKRGGLPSDFHAIHKEEFYHQD